MKQITYRNAALLALPDAGEALDVDQAVREARISTAPSLSDYGRFSATGSMAG